MRLKHSKYRNAGILFELLVRQITADTLKGENSPAIDLVKRYFVKTQLGKEYKLYESVLKSEVITETKANLLISTILESSSKLNRKSLKREKYNLIKEIKDNYDINTFFSTKLPNYKRLASVYTLIESFNIEEDVDTDQIVDNKITLLEFLTKEEVNTSEVETDVLKEFKEQDAETRALAYRILLEKFNEKLEAILKIAAPIKTVFRGTNEFNIDVIALSISVSAIANRKAGKKEPKNPEMIIHFHLVLSIFFKPL